MQPQPNPSRPRRIWFVSWRWRIVIPLFIAVFVVVTVGAYVVAIQLGTGFGVSQDNLLLESVRGVDNRANALYRDQLQEAQRVAFTIGVPEAVELAQVNVLRDNLEALARAAELDSLILTDVSGVEVLGVQRTLASEAIEYNINSGTNLSNEAIVRDALGGISGSAALFRTPEGTLVFVSTPLIADGEVVGSVLAGQHLANVADALGGTAVASVAVYSAEGDLTESTLDLTEILQTDLQIPTDVAAQTLVATRETIPVRGVTLDGTLYRAAYVPFNYGEATLGLVGVFLPDSLPAATAVGRQLVALMAAATAGVTVTVAFVAVAFFTGRVERVQHTAEALAQGQQQARTGMQPTDEAGATGAALDAYADRVQREQAVAEAALRRQRRETNHLVSVLQAIPDGVVVQSTDGAVTFINDEAKELLGGETVHHEALRTLMNQPGGSSSEPLAPGVYALGDPEQISVEDRMLHAQAAAVKSVSGERVGTVLVLRDISDVVQQEQQRDRLLQQVEQSLDDLAQTGAFGAPPVNAFAREITGRAVALQKLVVEMRELVTPEEPRQGDQNKAIRLDTLIWSVANEWRQIAQAADLKLDIHVAETGLHVLGEEKRLRWAVGNLLDNAIRYTTPGGTVSLEITGEDNGQATMRVRDSGVGIAPEELPHVTQRFYRGNPKMDTGEIIRTPGMGQGLYTARMIIEAQGGFMRVRSKPGIGTAVYFSLPVTADVTLDLPRIKEDFEGETVQLPQDYRRKR